MKEKSPDDSIGNELIETVGKRKRTGVALWWEYTGSMITNMKTGKKWPGFRFYMRSKSGKEWWTSTYADRSKPIKKAKS